jgi:hypothetical protein
VRAALPKRIKTKTRLGAARANLSSDGTTIAVLPFSNSTSFRGRSEAHAKRADHREQPQKRANFTAWTRDDSQVGARRNYRDEKAAG